MSDGARSILHETMEQQVRHPLSRPPRLSALASPARFPCLLSCLSACTHTCPLACRSLSCLCTDRPSPPAYSQTVSVAKAGIICSLNARTSILASANPIDSKYDPSRSVVANINLSPTLLSRFDLIYLILDRPDERTDRQLAEHLLALYQVPRAPDLQQRVHNLTPKPSNRLRLASASPCVARGRSRALARTPP